MIDVKGFSGILDSDNPPSGVAHGGHMMAFNGRFKGIQGLLRFENIEGNREIVFTKPAGDNECIGAFYSPVDNFLYWWNWNSNDSHCIFQIYMPTETVTNILQSGVNTDGDILNFDLDNPIHSADILYGSDGKFLYYVDSLGRPTEINLELFINNPYAITKREYIDVAKAPFIMPPKVSYENDETATANNFKNELFQFRYRPIYDNNEKPVSSSGSEVPLPYLPYDINTQKDVTKNARIAVYVSTGDVNVKAIQIEMRYAANNFVSDWLKVIVLDKAELSIPDNSIYRYLFLNDSVYPTLPTEGTDPNTQVLNLQDYVPKFAGTQCLLNGNVLGYANIIEGFDRVEGDMSIVAVTSTDGRANNKNGILFFAAQESVASIGQDNEITIYLSGVGDNDGSTNEPITLFNSANTEFHVRARVGVSTDVSFSYTEASGNANISDILDDISSAAQAEGFTEVSQTANTLTLSLNNVILQSSQVFSTSDVSVNESIYANALRASYAIGVEYFDSKGRTNGVVYAGSFNTLPESSATDAFELNIYHRPPSWAVYYHVVRSRNLTFNKVLNWVSESAFSTKSAVDGSVYAYIGISSIKDYNEQFSSTEGVVSYEFQKGDRIRFIARYLLDGSVTTTGFENLDYEILGVVNNPILDGEVNEGTFVKIAYPSADVGGDFELDGSDEYQNYHILLYNKADKLQPELEFYYEFGQQYGIGNAGTNTAYHAGMTQSQSEDLSQPAKILLDKGDWFLRYRNVVSRVAYEAQAGGNRFGNRYSSARITFTPEIANTSYEIQSNEGHPAGTSVLDYPTFADDEFLFYNLSAQGVNIGIKATIVAYADHDTAVDVYLKQAGIVTAPGETLYTVVEGVPINGGTTKEIVIDGVFYVSAGCKVWLLIGNVDEVIDVQVRLYPFELTVLKYTNISIVEPSFSDLYNLRLSANSRVTVIDESAAEIHDDTRFRWGLSYLQGTNINNINRFYATNYDQWDRAKGAVRRLKVRERILKVFQSKAVGRVGIYAKFVQDNAGLQILTTTDDIITKNNINYYQGEYGMGDYPTNLISTDAFDGFVDPIRGYQVISDNSGLRAVNELYLGQYYISSLFSKYNKEWTKADGSRAKIMHVYNYIDEEWNCILEGGENDDEEIEAYNFSFNLKRNGYSSFFSWHPEWSVSVEEKIIAWKDGDLWVHDNTVDFTNFFGVQYDCNIKLPFNKNQIEKKGWKGLVEQSNVVWECPEIYTQVMSYDDVPQESNLISSDFRLKEGMFHASFLRDVNSVKGLNNGDRLKGSYVVVTFQPTDSSIFVFLTSLSVKFLDSPLIPA